MVDGQSLRATFGERRVGVVNEVAGVGKQDGGSERRRSFGLNMPHGDGLFLNAGQQSLQAGQIEHVSQTFAVSFQHHRKAGIASRDGQQVG